MYQNLKVFRMANALAVHSSARQNVIATNVANSDTPGYRAADISPFADIYESRRTDGGLRASRAGHITPDTPGTSGALRVDRPGAASPNGNTVSLEAEMIASVETQHAHETALSIYATTRSILRTALGSGR